MVMCHYKMKHKDALPCEVKSLVNMGFNVTSAAVAAKAVEAPPIPSESGIDEAEESARHEPLAYRPEQPRPIPVVITESVSNPLDYISCLQTNAQLYEPLEQSQFEIAVHELDVIYFQNTFYSTSVPPFFAHIH